VKKVGFIGAGNMAQALIKGLLASRAIEPECIVASDVEREKLSALRNLLGIGVAEANDKVSSACDVIILAVKPAQVMGVLEEIKNSIKEGSTLVSIAAGVRLSAIEATLGGGVRVARAMPNAPALVGCGATAVCFNPLVGREDKDYVLSLFRSVGYSFELESEELMDAVTALSGSGPAFASMFIEALSDGGVKMGLPRDLALRLSAEAVSGASQMIIREGMHPGSLKDMVASPGGTTIEGISALEERGFRGAIISAVESSCKRSKELSRGVDK
jgi:pyrroline-5-carboxylate reductase